MWKMALRLKSSRNKPVQPKGLAEGKLIVTYLNQNIAAKLIESSWRHSAVRAPTWSGSPRK
jgi:hypothetical protein